MNDVLSDLRGVIRIARAASNGVTGNSPRIERAEHAVEAFSKLIAAMKQIAAGEGYYGEQAREYKAIARIALDSCGIKP